MGDYSTAFAEFSPRAKNGDVTSEFYLGYLYHYGLGTTQDFSAALRWYRSAASKGHESAHFQLGAMYEHGDGVSANAILAHMWYNISSRSGDKLHIAVRDKFAMKLNQKEIAKAQKMANDCVSSNYQGCGY